MMSRFAPNLIFCCECAGEYRSVSRALGRHCSRRHGASHASGTGFHLVGKENHLFAATRRRYSCAGGRPRMLNRGCRLSGRSGVIPPGDSIFIESESARVSSRKRSSENGPFTSSSEELGYNSKRRGFRRTLVCPRSRLDLECQFVESSLC
jgi:hypothetical protein